MAQYAYVVTGNTTSAIQAAIDTAHDYPSGPVDGGTVFLPAGTYTLESPVQLYPNVRLEGVGSRTILKPAGGTGLMDRNLIELKPGNDSTVHDITVCNLVLYGPGTGDEITDDVSSNYYEGCGIYAENVEVCNVSIEHCTLENLSGCGILFNNTEDHLISNVDIRNCVLLNNRCPSNSALRPNYKDIYFYGTRLENITIEGNSCLFVMNEGLISDGEPVGNDSGIAYVYSAGATGRVSSMLISHNVCSGHYRHGIIAFYGQCVFSGCSIDHNTCDNNGWLGIYANSDIGELDSDELAVSRLTISRNYCNYNGFYDNNNTSIRGGIVIAGSVHTVVSDNVCNRNGSTTLDDVTPVANAEHAAGIRLRGDEIVAQGNIAAGNKDCGITTWSPPSYRMSIIGNRCLENEKSGILIQGNASYDQSGTGRGFLVTGNTCSKNEEAGIRVYYMNGALIGSNHCRCNTDYGIKVDTNTDHILVHDNLIAYATGSTPLEPSTANNNNVYSDNVSYLDSSCPAIP